MQIMTMPWCTLVMFGGTNRLFDGQVGCMGEAMWYALQTTSGSEQKTLEFCEKLLDKDVFEECFIPKYECMRNFKGEWHKKQNILFSGYIFVITKDVAALHDSLKAIPSFAKLVTVGNQIVPLAKQEVEFLKTFAGGNLVIEMSEGYVESDEIVFTQGPLVGYAGVIRKINRHKRIAILEVNMFSRAVQINVGLEIVRKA